MGAESPVVPSTTTLVAHCATASHSGCLNVANGHSLKGEYCDMSGATPYVVGTVHFAPDCAGTGYPYRDEADGKTCSPAAGPVGENTWCTAPGSCSVFKSIKHFCGVFLCGFSLAH